MTPTESPFWVGLVILTITVLPACLMYRGDQRYQKSLDDKLFKLCHPMHRKARNDG